MNRQITKFDTAQFLFFPLFVAGTIANTCEIPGENRFLRMILLLCGLFSLVKIFTDSYPRKEIVIWVGLLILSIGINLKSSELSPFVTIVVLFVCGGIAFDWLVDITLYTKVILITIRLCMIYTGIIENEAVSFWRDGGYVLRYKFGFSALNTFQVQLAVITLLLIYKLFKKNYTKKYILIYLGLLMINAYFYKYTLSRTSYLVSTAIILMSLLVRKKSIFDLCCKLARFVMPGWMVLSFAGMLLMGHSSVMKAMDILFTGRLGYSHRMFMRFGLSFLGADISGTDIIYDNSYTRLLINLGLIYSMFIFGSMYKITKKASQEKNIALIFLLIGYQSLAFTESIYGYVFANLTLLLIAPLIHKEKKEKAHEEKNYNIYANLQSSEHTTGFIPVTKRTNK